jgi:hypothetical protein
MENMPVNFIYSFNHARNTHKYYVARLEATFFASSSQFPPAPRADLIVPLTLAKNMGNEASVPPGFSVRSQKNCVSPKQCKVILSLARSYTPSKRCRGICRVAGLWKRRRGVLGAFLIFQGFQALIGALWCKYFNVPNQFFGDFPNGTTFGEGPFREVRVLVDGQVAGVAFPYPVIFTGGIVPTAWRYVLPLPHRASASLRSSQANHLLRCHRSSDLPS